MAKYKIIAESIGYLEEIIEADNENEAYAIMDEKLDNGAMEEVDGAIENKRVEKV